MAKTEQELRQDIIEIGRHVYQKGWVAANDGNISIRLDQDRVLCTPTGVSKGMMRPEDLLICDMTGRKIAGEKECTSEIKMHLTIYALRSDIRAVVHVHPPVATGFATAGRALNLALLPEVIIGLGHIPLADYGLPGTPELTDPMLPYIPRYNAMLLANHGAVAYAEEVWQAFFRMETVEHYARIALVAELLGGPNPLPRREVQKLMDARERYGVKWTPGFEPGVPVCAEEAGRQREEKISLTRSELLALIDEAIRVRTA
ncbi:MAG: class II aldolase/adducin family protein [Bryobacterales bacterium]|nr:class II aldolase/adducin family protein [Bryobacterales bacterium]